MKRMNIVLVVALVALGSFQASGQDQEKPRKGFFSVLKEGQTVTVREVGGRFEITSMDFGAPLGHKVTEVGLDHLTIEDIAGVTETRIPIYSITAIRRLRIPKK